ncbi:MAG: selenium cofactor biosynthesis protein YqeC [Clostridiales bacterium]|nr:selenium cofactor biosynthesis protein YqeC [Clostridiales bacterium]
MFLSKLLHIEKGVFATVGSGGKTTLLHVLARELLGRVIFSTTAHIYPPADIPLYVGGDATALDVLLARHNRVAVGTPDESGKLVPSPLPFAALRDLADYVLVEADGSRGLPMKAHAPYEPILPEIPHRALCVLGAAGFGRRIADAAHRPALYAERAGVTEQAYITPAIAARVLCAEGGLSALFINQCDTAAQYAGARECAAHLAASGLHIPVFAGSLQEGTWICL